MSILGGSLGHGKVALRRFVVRNNFASWTIDLLLE
jgi:hypothetical protein